MSVFDNLRSVLRTEEPEYTYECKGCGKPFELQHQVCPSCGGFRVERIDWNDLPG